MTLVDDKLRSAIRAFNEKGQLGPDPLAARYADRRAAFSLFARQMSEADIEALRQYLFCYAEKGIAQKPGDAKKVVVRNFIAGEWRAPASGEHAEMASPADRRVKLFDVPASGKQDVEAALAAGDKVWKSLAWADEGLAYRKQVVKNVARILNYFTEEYLHEIRQQIPKTRLEAEKDFFEAKRACDHLEGSFEAAIKGEMVPDMFAGQKYWRDAWLPAGLAAIVTPMNFIWGIPMIHLAGAYLAGCPWILKGHPFAALTNTSMVRAFLAAGADPRFVQKVEGFGKGIAPLATDHRVAVTAVTGSSDTARSISAGRGLARTRFEGGGCNWSYVDDGYSDEELSRIAARLTYAKLGLSSHKCTGLHGVSGTRATLDRLVPLIVAEMDRWQAGDPRAPDASDRTLGPLMVHKAQTALDLVSEARKAGLKIVREGGRAGGEYGQNAEAVKPALIDGVTPQTTLRHDWDGKGVKEYQVATTELFMPILVAMALPDFEAFVRFSLFDNPHDLATSIWTRDDKKLTRARRTLAGMIKENDGTDSALEWEEFGASTVGESGNMGVGEITATISIYARRQKGRHFVF
ncbi:MAG: aldehyde dehydrogenase [Deltaproteobacteria bacterium]|nr:MAG: aldehyde dehydrogenase [Deltaproteobacteria bacterium]